MIVLMDYNEFWQKWLTQSVEVIVKNNIIKSSQGGELIPVETSYVSQAN
jgi:hypothetical protein